MNRFPMVSFCVLAAATVAAFFITQHLKVTTPLLAGYPRPVPAVINPVSGTSCGGVDHRRMRISFYLLHRSDTVDVWITQPGGAITATLATNRFMRGGARPVRGYFTWNGRQSDGRFAPDGTYYVKVALLHQGRTVIISDPSGPLPVRVKTRPPAPRVVGVQPQLISAPAAVHIRYLGNQSRGGTVRVYRTDVAGAPRLVKSFLTPWRGQTATWDGRIRQQPAPAGVYLIGLDVTDAACDTGHFPPRLPPAPGTTPGAGLTVRYLAAQPPITPVTAGGRATVLVDSRRRRYSWSLWRPGARRPAAAGTADSYALRIPVPGGRAGLYELALRSAGRFTSVPLVAASSQPANLLVVVPAMNWEALTLGDEDGDGIPDSLSGQSSVELARPLAAGLPSGFGDVAGVLSYLDAIHRPYQLTTDYALGLGSGTSLTGHRAVLLAGNEEWTTPQLATALRSYVAGGGHLVSLGIASLQRTVTVSGSRASGATPPSPTDALGARPEPVQSTGRQLIGVLQDRLGIFNRTAGLFKGFRAYQPFGALASGARLLSAAGATSNAPAIIGYRLGRGVVLDFGLPDLGSLLAHNIDARQLISQALNVLDR